MSDERMMRYPEEPYGWSSSQMAKFSKALYDYAHGIEPTEYASDENRLLALDLAKTVPDHAPIWMWGLFGQHRVLARQKQDCTAFGVMFDSWSRESSLLSPRLAPITSPLCDLTELRRQGMMGNVFQDGKGGPICINCAHRLTPITSGRCEPCDFCLDAGFYPE